MLTWHANTEREQKKEQERIEKERMRRLMVIFYWLIASRIIVKFIGSPTVALNMSELDLSLHEETFADTKEYNETEMLSRSHLLSDIIFQRGDNSWAHVIYLTISA